MFTRLRAISLKIKLLFSVPYFITANYKSPSTHLWRLLVGGDQTKIITLKNGLQFRIWQRRGHAILTENYNGSQYVKPQISLKPGDTIIDIGAHIGTFCICLAKKYSGLRIFSFEPAPTNYPLLLENIKLNGFEGSIKPAKLAVSSQEGFADMFLSENTGGSSIVFRKSEETLSVPTTTLKQILDQYNITDCDLLKIDAEGSEYQILLSATKEVLGKVRQVALEYSPNNDLNEAHIAEFLRAAGFEVTVRSNPKWNIQGGLMFATRK